MIDLQKYRAAIEEKIRFVEKSTTASLLPPDLYGQNVGHVTGLLDALAILDEQLVERDEQENEDDGEDSSQA